MSPLPVLLGSFSTWLLPFWLITLGVAGGWVILAGLYGMLVALGRVWPAARRFTSELPSLLQEGFLKPLLIVAGVLAGIAVLAGLLDIADVVNLRPAQVFRSLVRLPFPRTWEQVCDVPAAPENSLEGVSQSMDVDFNAADLDAISLAATQDVEVRIVDENTTKGVTLKLAADPLRDSGTVARQWNWTRGSGAGSPFMGRVARLEFVNHELLVAHVTFKARTSVEIPEVIVIPWGALALVLMVLGYCLLRALLPKAAAIAAATCKEGLSQPLFYLLLLGGMFTLFVYVVMPQNTFGEDIKMYKEAGVTLVLIVSLVVALWTASVSVADEIEGRTAVTVLSKPVSRAEFIGGKFLGVIQPVAIMFIVQGAFLLAATSFKGVYEARETARAEPNWVDCYREMMTVLPGLALAFMEVVVFTSISVAVSTRLPMLPNLLIGLMIYALGHLVPRFVESEATRNVPLVAFVGKLLATVIPVVDHFDIQAAYSSNRPVPIEYLGTALLFCALYSTAALLVGLFLFEDRDVA